MLNIDTDTYGPAAHIIDLTTSRLGKGSLVLFDEFFNYPNWRAYEYRAWRDHMKEEDWELVGFARRQAMFRKT